MIIETNLQPISVNHYWEASHTGGRFITPKGRRFKRDLGFIAQAAAKKHRWTYDVEDRIRMTIGTAFSDRRRRDIDNSIKGVCDALKGILYEDDCQIDDLRVFRLEHTGKPRLIIEVEKITPNNKPMRGVEIVF